MKKCLKLTVNGETCRLRLTLGGQKRLKSQRNEDTLQTILAAAGDAEAMAALLEEALNWEGSGNTVTDGEELYDLLVDNGYAGQEDFGGLAFDIAAVSGLLTEKQVKALKCTMAKAVGDAFGKLEPQEEPPDPLPETAEPA